MSVDGDVATFENVEAKGESAKALLVRIDGKSYWCPKSQIHDDSEVFSNGGTGKLIVAQWWAEQEGLV